MTRGTCATVAVAALAALPAGASAAVAVYPSAGTPDASVDSQISFRGATPAQLQAAAVSGSRSGSHVGRWIGHSDRRGASFLPSTPFSPDETVTVNVPATPAGPARAVRFRTAGTTPRFTEPTQGAAHRFPRSAVQRFLSRPDLAPPQVKTDRYSRAVAPGDVFVAPKLGLSQQGPMIIGPTGGLLWFQPLRGDQQAFDFRTQTYRGKPVLTWWQGTIQGFHGRGEGEILDTSYRHVRTVRATSGYAMDLHEFTLTPQNTALITVYAPVPADLSSVGGPKHGLVYDCIVQEIDVRTGAMVFEWHSFGNVPLRDSYFPLHIKGFPTPAYDPFHLNSIDREPNGNLLISARHTHALYEVDRATGRVLWRLGGKRSMFRAARGATFAWQHDARRNADGTVSLFDNAEQAKRRGSQSSAMVLRVDTTRRTVSLVRGYRHAPPLLAPTQGSAQVLPNRDVFVGWGGTNTQFSEYSPGGSLLFDSHFLAPGTESYRAYRLRWDAQPADPPRLFARRDGGRTLVWATWNGATRVARWRGLTGDSRTALAATGADARATAFETRIAVPGAHRYAAVQALDASGQVLGTSAVATVAPR